jgi:hypothetical protein
MRPVAALHLWATGCLQHQNFEARQRQHRGRQQLQLVTRNINVFKPGEFKNLRRYLHQQIIVLRATPEGCLNLPGFRATN